MWNSAKAHLRWLLAWLCCAFVLAVAWPVRADDDFSAIHVCVRPDIVPAGVAAWVFTANADRVILTIPRADFKKQAGDLTAYVYDPYAPPDSVKLLPKKFSNLVCPPPPAKVLPPAPEPKKDAPKTEDKKAATGGTVTADPKKKADKKKEKDEEEPPDLPPPLTHPPPPEWHPKLPKGGVTEKWPGTVLPIVERPAVLPSVASGHGVLPIAGLDSKGTVLPMAGAHNPSTDEPKADSKDANANTAKPGTGVQKTAYEKACEQIALAGGLVNLQLGEDIHRKDGSRYGIPGGHNPNGIKSATAQAVAGGVMVLAAVITAGGFDKKLYDALRKGTPVFIQGSGKAAEQAADKLLADAIVAHGKHGAEDLAAALAKNGAIGEYSVMARFTKGLGARWQAHHLLEVKMAEKIGVAATDRIPAVILSEAEHKAITKALAAEAARGTSKEALWTAYQKIYAAHPAWLKAIEHYFVQ